MLSVASFLVPAGIRLNKFGVFVLLSCGFSLFGKAITNFGKGHCPSHIRVSGVGVGASLFRDTLRANFLFIHIRHS